MNLLSDIITYVRRIIKTPSNASITDNLIIDYINRFWLMDVDARMQLFDLKTTFKFQTIPGISDYNMPLYNFQYEGSMPTTEITPFPVYQGFLMTAYANGIQIPFYTLKDSFWKIWPNYIQSLPTAGIGNGTAGPYTLNLPYFPAIPGHVDMTGIIATGQIEDPLFVSTLNLDIPSTSVNAGVFLLATDVDGNNITVTDSGQFLSGSTGGDLYGLLINPGPPPFGNAALAGGYSTTSNTVNYATGSVNVTFPSAIPAGEPIQAQCYFYQPGIPRAVLYYNNTLTLRPPPPTQYLMEFEGYLSPAAFLTSGQAIPFAYMAEYVARGAARKILADTGDVEQFQFYEPLFREQEQLVWKRSQRVFTTTRTPTIFSDLQGPQSALGSAGQGAT